MKYFKRKNFEEFISANQFPKKDDFAEGKQICRIHFFERKISKNFEVQSSLKIYS